MRDGTVVVATTHGLCMPDRPPYSVHFNLPWSDEDLDLDRGTLVHFMLETADGRIWCAMYHGLLVWDGKRLQQGEFAVDTGGDVKVRFIERPWRPFDRLRRSDSAPSTR